MVIDRKLILTLLTAEKENWNLYLQQCGQYQAKSDPLVEQRHLGRMEILDRLLQDLDPSKKNTTGI